jgi:hypothetical protein
MAVSGDGPEDIIMGLKLVMDAGCADPKILDYFFDGGRYTSKQDTVLTIACAKNCIEVVRVLLDAKADVNARTSSNITPLMALSGVKDADKEIADLLVKAGADVHVQNTVSFGNKDENGWTALFGAVKQKNARLVKTLLDAGADLSHADAAGRTVLMAVVGYICPAVMREIATSLVGGVPSLRKPGKVVGDYSSDIADEHVSTTAATAAAKCGYPDYDDESDDDSYGFYGHRYYSDSIEYYDSDDEYYMNYGGYSS